MGVREIRSAGEFRKAINHELTVVDFGAPWSEACRLQELIMRHLAFQLEGRACLATVNIDQTPALASRFGIRSIPMLVIFHKCKEVQRFVGLQSEDILLGAIRGIPGNDTNLDRT